MSRSKKQCPHPAAGRFFWVAVTAVFLLGLFLRIRALDIRPQLPPSLRQTDTDATRWTPARLYQYLENDEKIYIALVEQLDRGHGYTLQGHPILHEPWIVHEQYDRKLFFHPPGGIALFWLAHRIAGDAGYALAQLLSFSIFFWSTFLLGRVLLQPFNRTAALSLAVAAAFTPIMTQVAGRLWLDGPLLAFSAAATALFVLSVKRNSTGLVCAGAVLLGYASLIKLTAFLVVPGMAAIAWTITPRKQRRAMLLRGLLFVAVAVLIQSPWEIWQWRTVGSPFPTWAGKPSPQLIATNFYVRYLTVMRSPWIYAELLPQTIWTLVPSLVLLAAQWRKRELRNRGLALVFWMAVVLAFHITLGAIGYSKLLRYIILVTPATAVLFALVVGGAMEMIRGREPIAGGRTATIALLILAAIGLGLEITQGLKTALVDNRSGDIIRPLPGLRGIDYD